MKWWLFEKKKWEKDWKCCLISACYSQRSLYISQLSVEFFFSFILSSVVCLDSDYKMKFQKKKWNFSYLIFCSLFFFSPFFMLFALDWNTLRQKKRILAFPLWDDYVMSNLDGAYGTILKICLLNIEQRTENWVKFWSSYKI